MAFDLLKFSRPRPHDERRQRGRRVDRLGRCHGFLGHTHPISDFAQHLADELCMFDNVPESITRFFDQRSSSFATRHSPNMFGSALAAPSGDFKAFACEPFMSDYVMGDGGHVFRTC